MGDRRGMMFRRAAGAARLAGLAVFAAAALVAGAPASAGDVAELACPAAGMTRSDRRVLDAAARETDYNAPRPAAVVERLVAACASRFQWTAEERRDAAQYLRASTGQALFRRRLEGRGLDLAMLEREVIADRALIRAAVDMRQNPPELDAFIDRMAPVVGPWLLRHSGERRLTGALGGLFATTAIVEGSRIRFSAR